MTGEFSSFSFVTWYVGNAKQAASYYNTRYGFKPFAYSGLETGARNVCSHVVSNGKIVFNFVSVIKPENRINNDNNNSHNNNQNNKYAKDYTSLFPSKTEKQIVNEILTHQTKHGDGIKDIAFEVDNVEGLFKMAVSKGAKVIEKPHEIYDESGVVKIAVINAYGDTTHTLINKKSYSGIFLPAFKCPSKYILQDSLLKTLPPINYVQIDHVVGNQDWNEMEKVCKYYENTLGFHRFWSVDDKQIHTKFSALKSIVMSSPEESIKMPINEPAPGLKKSQIEEFIEYYDGPGVQHIALLTDDIITTVESLRKRGADFLDVPESYYENVSKRLLNSKVKVKEAFLDIKKHKLLIDFDDNGYLLQIFTKPLLDRPTVFFEIIQRCNFDGFGAGNFKSLFEAIEREQEVRGNL